MTAKKNKKGPTKGSGGKNRSSLEGKKGTLPAEERHWYGSKQQSGSAKQPNQPAQSAQPKQSKPPAARPPERGGDAPRAQVRLDGGGPELLVGRNPIVEALRAGVPATKLFVANSMDKDDRVNEAARLAGDAGIDIFEVARSELDRRCDSNGQPGAAHQGLALQVRPYRYWHADDLLDAAQRSDTTELIIALDGVTDPHNLGAIARSAAAFGAHGLLLPQRRAAGVSMAAWKASAGTLARLPIAQTTNLTRALQGYKDAGMFIAGLDADSDTRLDRLDLATGPLVAVIGSEGKGLSRLVRETCDAVAGIPISGAESLNASVAAGVCLYEVVRRRTAAE